MRKSVERVSTNKRQRRPDLSRCLDSSVMRRFKLKFRNGVRSCATCAPGIRKYSCVELVELDEVAVALLMDMLCSEIREWMLHLYTVDGDLFFFHELLLRLDVGVEGKRPQAVQGILLEKRCQTGCFVACLSRGGRLVARACVSAGSPRTAPLLLIVPNRVRIFQTKNPRGGMLYEQVIFVTSWFCRRSCSIARRPSTASTLACSAGTLALKSRTAT